MKNIVKLKIPKSKTSRDIEEVLISALSECKKSKFRGIAISMYTDDATYTTYCITKKGSFIEMLGTMEICKHKVLKAWDAC